VFCQQITAAAAAAAATTYSGHDGDDPPAGRTDGRTGKGGNSAGQAGRNWRRADEPDYRRLSARPAGAGVTSGRSTAAPPGERPFNTGGTARV